jgi:sec-independent protein translocase protein TatA
VNIASLFNLAGPDLIIILLIVMLLFGAKKLPELGRGMAEAEKAEQPEERENPMAAVNRLLVPLAIAIFLLACGLWAFGNGR